MYMSDQEIVGSYRRADNKNKQVKTLSELNACGKEDIMEVLKKNGEIEEKAEPATQKKRGRKPKEPSVVPEIVRAAVSEKMVKIQESIDAKREIVAKQQEVLDKADEDLKESERQLQELSDFLKEAAG